MCNRAGQLFVQRHLSDADIAGKSVLEVGAYDVNGSTREAIERFKPMRYLGIDIQPGPGVDELCDIGELVSRYGEGTFDLVITTEVLEHVEHWRHAFDNLKKVLKPGGILLLTTRSKGFGFHGYPMDFWRYEPDDISAIFSDFDIEALERDTPQEPGIFVRVRKPLTSRAALVNLDAYALYSIILNRRALSVPRTATLALRLTTPFWYRLKRHIQPSAVARLRSLSNTYLPPSAIALLKRLNRRGVNSA